MSFKVQIRFLLLESVNRSVPHALARTLGDHLVGLLVLEVPAQVGGGGGAVGLQVARVHAALVYHVEILLSFVGLVLAVDVGV